MKKFKVLSIVCIVLFLLAAMPVTAFASEFLGPNVWVEGPASVEVGSTAVYQLWCEEVFSDGNNNVYNDSLDFPEDVAFIIFDPDVTGAGTTITLDGVLTIDPNETDTVITIFGYDLYYEVGAFFEITVTSADTGTDAEPDTEAGTPGDYAPPPAGEDLFWYGVHQNFGNSIYAATTEGQTYVPYFIFDIIKDTGKTLTLYVGEDIFIISAKGASTLRDGTSYSFLNLAGHSSITNDNNARGGVTYTL